MPRFSTARFQLILPWMLCGLWFAAWHIWLTSRAWADPLYRIPGPIGDNTVMLWNLGWVKYALNHGSPGFWFTNAYYPDGFLFLFGTHTWLDGVLGWLAQPVMPGGVEGTILWANIMMLISTVATGLTAMAGMRSWGIKQWPVLLLAASGLTFCWFRMFAAGGHYHFFGTQWMLGALALLSQARALAVAGETSRSWRWTAAAGLMLGITFLNDQTMMVFAAVLAVAILAAFPARSVSSLSRGMATRSGLFYGIALLPAAIHLVPIFSSIVQHKFEYKVDLKPPRLVDASSLILPPEPHFAGGWIQPFRDAHGLHWQEGTYLGIVPFVLLICSFAGALVYLTRRKIEQDRHLRLCFWATAAAGVCLVLALGDGLLIGTKQYFALPGFLTRYIPVVNAIRIPQRWVWPTHICIALGGAAALSLWIERIRNPSWAWILVPLAAIPGLEGKSHPEPAPVDYRDTTMVRPQGLINAVRSRYQKGGVLTMPIGATYAHSNILQFLWGYDIPITVAYTARMPFSVNDVPWKGSQWTPETGQWLRDKQVSLVVFPYHEGPVDEYQGWIKNARLAVPGLVALNRNGEELK